MHWAQFLSALNAGLNVYMFFIGKIKNSLQIIYVFRIHYIFLDDEVQLA